MERGPAFDVSEIKMPLENGLTEKPDWTQTKNFQELNARSGHAGENENKY